MLNHHSGMTEPQRILLGPSASQALTDAGPSVFLVIGRASWPEDPSRWVLHLVPVDSIKTANDAVSVARGEATVRRPKAPKAGAL